MWSADFYNKNNVYPFNWRAPDTLTEILVHVWSNHLVGKLFFFSRYEIYSLRRGEMEFWWKCSTQHHAVHLGCKGFSGICQTYILMAIAWKWSIQQTNIYIWRRKKHIFFLFCSHFIHPMFEGLCKFVCPSIPIDFPSISPTDSSI